MSEQFRETLYTVDKRGHRKWVYATVVAGRFRKWRSYVMVALMGFYLLMPWITIRGEQGILLDIAKRRFVVFGAVFVATDTIYLFLMLAIGALALFLVTAVVGRIWCGWACPETVFLEFLFRPIERWIEGDHLARRKLDAAPWSFEKVRKKFAKHAIFAALAWVIANTFLAYFVGREILIHMMLSPPWQSPFAFGVLLFVLAAMAFQFGWFREQFCTIVCPYGRFQSVLLDQQSLVIGYDSVRGEPRGKVTSGPAVQGRGDCVDCGACVRVCPTGIDIRNGLQMECINCTACIDACDAVMTKVGRALGLIRYASQSQLEGKPHRILRPRVVIYTVLLIGAAVVLGFRLSARELSEFHIVRGGLDAPYSEARPGVFINHLHLRLTNKGREAGEYLVEAIDLAEGMKLVVPVNPYPVAADSTVTVPIFVEFPLAVLVQGKRKITVRVQSAKDRGVSYSEEKEITVLGPGGR